MLLIMPNRTIAISGASGLIGSALAAHLEESGSKVLRLVRRAARTPAEIVWNPAARQLDPASLSAVDAVVNLAGTTIGQRWFGRRRGEILRSRIDATETIVGAIAKSDRPATLVNGSAVGFYGSRGDELLDETSSGGSGYLAGVCREWEAAADRATATGSRVVKLRTGVVLSDKAGALPQMLRPFRLFVGGRVGSGRQWLSWIDIEDMVRAISFLIDTPTASGAFNLVAPNPVTNAEFTATVAQLMHRPALFPVPAFVLKLLFGEMAEQTLLASQRAMPRALQQAGFVFSRPTIRESLARFV